MEKEKKNSDDLIFGNFFFFFQYQVSQQLDFGGGTLEKDTWEYLLHFNFW